LDAVVIPTGGAGLLAGMACALKTVIPCCKVYAVEPELCASFKSAMEAGRPVDFPSEPTLADGLAVPKVGSNAFEVARWYTDDVVTVGEHAIAIAVLRILEAEKLVVEGGGAIGLSPLLPGGPLHEKLKGKKVVIPLCGGNIDSSVLGKVIDRGLAADGRLVRFMVQISDRPGGLHQMLSRLEENGMSIWDVSHERAWLRTNVDRVVIKVIGETQDTDHAKRLYQILVDSGYKVVWENESDCQLFQKRLSQEQRTPERAFQTRV
jgi:threonine dehydratase